MTIPLTFDKASIINALSGSAPTPASSQLEVFKISLPPEARLFILLANPDDFASFEDFAIAALRHWQETAEIDRAVLPSYLEQAAWSPLTAEQRDKMLRHIDYSLPTSLTELLNGSIQVGALLYQQWDDQAALFGTEAKFIAFFWTTYV